MAILTGPPGTGKTATCRRLADHVRQLGLKPAGVLCPARLLGAVKVGIDVVDVRTDERRRLAEIDELPGPLRMGPYRFDEEAVAWGAARLGLSCPCDVLVVDEIGPLEMGRGKGWTNALEVLRAGDYGLAVVVVRPSLVEAVRAAITSSGTRLVREWAASDPMAFAEILSLVE
jgi:nucleoside-triphosphatase THEP1